jgi:hypothetical protein
VEKYWKKHLASYKKPSYVKRVYSLRSETVGHVMKDKLREASE